MQSVVFAIAIRIACTHKLSLINFWYVGYELNAMMLLRWSTHSKTGKCGMLLYWLAAAISTIIIFLINAYHLFGIILFIIRCFRSKYRNFLFPIGSMIMNFFHGFHEYFCNTQILLLLSGFTISFFWLMSYTNFKSGKYQRKYPTCFWNWN